ncbi:Mur ligase family protein [Pseudosulfitobacter sp. SM2401]|uniref:Mur ligase family protein n=1 Tax=Pseudosulfitobacter sp. SM2401 TaxID=3350098 RepID=UPI0036F2949E
MAIEPQLKNTRRLTGANFLMSSVGAAAEARIDDQNKPFAMALWRAAARTLLDGVGWTDSTIAMRAFDGGATLQVSAPTDALYAATDLVEASWAATTATLAGETYDTDATVQKLRDQIAAELSPKEVALAQRAREQGVTYLGHDDKISLGLGCGAKVYDTADLPAPDAVDWDALHDVPVAMVTGTNGKSTTVRLTAAIGAAAGKCVGLSSSDWVRVGGEILDEGDYSGPAGARLAVRDPRVELAIIETARGGLMRRGLPVPTADACLLTNIAADHLGTYGIMDVTALADAKFQLSQAVRPGGRLVLNADDPELVVRSPQFAGEITWFGLDFDQASLEVWIATGGRAAFVSDGQMMLARDGKALPVLAVNDFVPALRGAAKFNVYNALGAIGLADALGLPVSAMADGLAGFTDSPDENPGRGNYLEVGGLTLLIDFAHNPHGVLALASAIKSIPANRRLVIAGQAGDRSDQDTCDMIQAMWTFAPDMVVVAELPDLLRGRQPGELTEVMSTELLRLGAREEGIIKTGTEISAVIKSLEWARPGDFLALLVHDDRIETMALLEKLQQTGWQAGEPLPV